MCMLFLSPRSPIGHGLWRCRGRGLLGLGVFISLPPTACPHAFVAGPSFWVAAATGTSWNILLVANLTTGYFFPSPLWVLTFSDPFILAPGGQCQLVTALVSVLIVKFPRCLFSRWCRYRECQFLNTFTQFSIPLWRNTYGAGH